MQKSNRFIDVIRTRIMRFNSGDNHYTIIERRNMGGPVKKQEYYSWDTPQQNTAQSGVLAMSDNEPDEKEISDAWGCIFGVFVLVLCICAALVFVILRSPMFAG